MTITLGKDFFTDEQKFDVFAAALIRTKDIEEAAKASEGCAFEEPIIALNTKESSDVYSVLGKAVWALGYIYNQHPNEGNLKQLEVAKEVHESFGHKKSIGGYSSDKARDKAYMESFAEDCAKYGCD